MTESPQETEMPQDQSTGWPPPPYLPPPPPHRTEHGVLRYDGATYARTFGYRPRLLDVHVPAATAPVPAVVWIHGGGWMDGDRRYPRRPCPSTCSSARSSTPAWPW